MGAAGEVVSIHLASSAGLPMRAVDTAEALAGRGLDGDRYAAGAGHWSAIRRSGDELTLIESEELERIVAETGLDLPAGATRRNLTTQGVRLDDLMGRRFRIGGVVCRGVRRCEPCAYLDDLLGQEALHALVHRAGIRAEILTSGTVAVGDPVELLDDQASIAETT